MLMPALKKARETARRATCQNKQKQIGQAAYTYISDYEGYIPPSDAYNTISSSGIWHMGILKDYIGFQRGPISGTGDEYNYNFACPSDANAYVADGLSNFLNPSYGMNIDLGAYPPHTGFKKINMVKNTSDKILVIERKQYEAGVYSAHSYMVRYNYGYRYIPLRHLNTTNMLWVDGHVSAEDINFITRILPAAYADYIESGNKYWLP
jgi:prepilin-type processing-associated H-X9-DG protein